MKNPENQKMEMSVITETGEVQTVKKLTPTRKKAILGAAVILGACTLVLGGIMQIALAAETSTIEDVKTTYAATSTQEKPNDLEGYVKGNYTIQSLHIDKPPSDNDISMQEAAEIGAQNIWRLFGDNLDGKQIRMMYDSSYPSWSGDVSVNLKGVDHNGLEYQTVYYHFQVSAQSGTLYSVGQSRIYPSSAQEKFNDLEYDANLEQHHEEYEKMAREAVEKHHLLGGNITSVDYSGQGYGTDGRHVDIIVISDIGEIATLRYSCEDQSLLHYFSNDWQFAAKLKFANQSEEDIGKMTVWHPASVPTEGNTMVSESP